MELVAIYNEARTTQNTHRRGEPLPQGWYMVIAAVWVVNKRGELLLTLRSPEKKEYPNTWENPGGAVLAGETSKQGMVRELREETGIMAEESQLEFLYLPAFLAGGRGYLAAGGNGGSKMGYPKAAGAGCKGRGAGKAYCKGFCPCPAKTKTKACIHYRGGKPAKEHAVIKEKAIKTSLFHKRFFYGLIFS